MVERLRKRIETLSPQENAIARHVITGESVIDSHSAFFASLDDVDRLLKINGFDWNDREDQERLQSIHSEARGYVESLLERKLDKLVREPQDLREIFLLTTAKKDQDATQFKEFPPEQPLAVATQACLLLKVMNIINHIDGHELLFSSSVNRRELSQRVDDKIGRVLSGLKGSGFPITFFEGSRKPKESLITKLLCKRSTVASRINDRLRYQVITREKIDIVALIVELFTTVLPFNYLVPGATVNKLIDPSLLLTSPEFVSHRARDMAHSIARSVSHLFPHSREELDFTGSSYQTLKFVVDVPVRLGTSPSLPTPSAAQELGRVVYSLVEVTMVDEETFEMNQQGENAHPLYKKRQKKGALQRMLGSIFES